MRDEALPEAEKDGEMPEVGEVFSKPGKTNGWNPNKSMAWVDVCSDFPRGLSQIPAVCFREGIYRFFFGARTRFGEQRLMYMDMFIWVNSSYISRCFSLI